MTGRIHAETHGMPHLQTERLRLEPLTAHHAAAFLAFVERNRAHLARWEPERDDTFYTLAYHQDEIARSEANVQRGTEARFIAFDGASSEIVASVNLWNIRRGAIQAATIGYSVDVACEGRGYATECARAVVRYAFNELNLHRVETSYQPLNERSGRVLRKLGFVVEGYARDHLLIAGTWRDGILVALTNETWRPALAR
jgi:ribosomal-protein-alanine N-acetyltransferase